jgi:hypothetical protein
VLTEGRVFNAVGAFLYLVAGLYAWWTDYETSIEWTGTIVLLLSGTLCAMCGLYFGFVARRIPPRPEDRGDADQADAAGDVGFFSPYSYWPAAVGAAAAIVAAGVVFGQWWLLLLGVAAVLGSAGGMLFEYYAGSRRAGAG